METVNVFELFSVGEQDKSKEDWLVSSVIAGMTYNETGYKKETVYASSSLCPRRATFEIGEVQEYKNEPITLIAKEIGIVVEELVIQAIKRSGILYAKNMKLSKHDTFPIGGIIDFIVKRPDGELEIVDCKTTGKNYVNGSKVHHVNQVLLYAALTGIKYGSILQVSRNLVIDGKVAIYYHKVDCSYEKKVEAVQKVVYAHLCNQRNIVPNTLGMKKSWCTYCPFINECYNNKWPEQDHIELLQEAKIEAVKIVTDAKLSDMYKN